MSTRQVDAVGAVERLGDRVGDHGLARRGPRSRPSCASASPARASSRRSPSRASSRGAPPARSSCRRPSPPRSGGASARRARRGSPTGRRRCRRARRSARCRPCAARRAARPRPRSGYVIEWSPPSTIGIGPALGHAEDLLVDHAERPLEPRGHDRRVAGIDDRQVRVGLGLELDRPRRTRGSTRWAPSGSRAARTARPAATRRPRRTARPRSRRRRSRRAATRRRWPTGASRTTRASPSSTAGRCSRTR